MTTPAHPTPAAVRPPVAAVKSDSFSFGRFDPDGTVWVRTDAGEVSVGQYAAGTPEEGLAFFVRKYDDLAAEAALSLTRLREGRATAEAATATTTKVREQLAEPKMVGDLARLAATCDEIDAEIAVQREKRAAEKVAAKAAALVAREQLVVEAESLAQSSQWKSTGERYRELLESWKTMPHADRSAEQALWKRFSTARSTFDKARRSHFAALETQRAEAVVAKERLIAEAETLATSTDWGPTRSEFRSILDRWKAAPRGTRKDEDAWWARFKAAQDMFFAASAAANDEREAEFRANAAVKEELLLQAQALIPVTDLVAARKALAEIQTKWESAGMVPRADKDRLDGGLRKVEDAVKSAESDRWRRTDPAKKAFAQSAVDKFDESITKLKAQRDKAAAAGDVAAVAKAEASIASTEPLLEAARASLAEYI